MMNGGELFKLARERRESEDQILDSVRESVLAELEGLASEAKQFVQQFESRLAAIVNRARSLVDSGDKQLEAGGRLPQGSSLADMHELDRQLSAIVEGGGRSGGSVVLGVSSSASPLRPDWSHSKLQSFESPSRPEIIAVRDGRD